MVCSRVISRVWKHSISTTLPNRRLQVLCCDASVHVKPSRLYSALASAILDEQPSAKSTSCIVIDTRDWSVMQETVMSTTTRKSSEDSGARRSNSCISFSHLAVRRITDDVKFVTLPRLLSVTAKTSAIPTSPHPQHIRRSYGGGWRPCTSHRLFRIPDAGRMLRAIAETERLGMRVTSL